MSIFRFFRHKTDLKEEIESHIRLATADSMARGEAPTDARRAAMREFGNPPLVAEVTQALGMAVSGAPHAGPALCPEAVAQNAGVQAYARARAFLGRLGIADRKRIPVEIVDGMLQFSID
jgi:hypothetical protein